MRRGPGGRRGITGGRGNPVNSGPKEPSGGRQEPEMTTPKKVVGVPRFQGSGDPPGSEGG